MDKSASKKNPSGLTLPLLVFAHPGESRAFVNKDRLLRASSLPGYPNYYEGERYRLLITEGGGEKTLSALTRVLTELSGSIDSSTGKTISKVSKIINLGIGGGLSPEVKRDSIYTIATSYAYRERKPVYESFPLIPPGPRPSSIRDCLTVPSPISHRRSRLRLSAFADIVDMELWWIAYAAKSFDLPVQAVKITSDDVDHPSLKAVSSRIGFYSQELYNWYQGDSTEKVAPQSRPSQVGEEIKKKIFAELTQTGVSHFTASQRRIIDSLLSQWIEKHYEKTPEKEIIKTFRDLKLLKSLKLQEIGQEKIKTSPKEKTAQVIERMKRILFPVSQKYHQRLKELTKVKGVRIGYDPLLESSEITVSLTASSSAEWRKKKADLDALPMENIENIFSLLQSKEDV